MSLRRVQWLTLVLAVVFVALADAVSFVPQWLQVGGHGQQHLLLALLLLAGVLPFTLLAFRFVIAPVYRTIQTQNQELRRLNEAARRHSAQLRAIHEAGSALTAELSQDLVRQAVTDLSRDLVQVDVGRLTLWRTSEGELLAAPNGPAERATSVTLDIPLRCKGATTGILHVERKDARRPFTVEDENVLRMFANQAAIALENARLHERVRALAVMEERERLAQELHDGFAQALAYVNTKTQAVQECLRQGEPETAFAEATSLVQSVRTLSEEVRNEIAGLWGSTALDRPLAAVIAECVERSAKQSGIQIQLIDEEDELRNLRLDIRERVQMLRILQEALANVRRHARAQQISVRCRREPKGFSLAIKDDGCGFTLEEVQGGYGLRTMRERAASIGGRLEIRSRPNAGTRVRLHLPMNSPIEESVS